MSIYRDHMKENVKEKLADYQKEAASSERERQLLKIIRDLEGKMNALERSQTVADPVETPLAIYRYTIEKLKGVIADES